MQMIDYLVRDHVAEILFNRPPVNTIDHAFMDRLFELLARAGADQEVRAIVIGSAIPGRFCAGLDLGQIGAGPHAASHAVVEKLYARLTEAQFALPKPTIAAIGGAVRGGGITVAISCDMIIAARDASFGYPEIDIGLLPAIHYTHLHRIIGRYRAFDLLFTGRVFSAEEAAGLGLVSRLAAPGTVLDEARAVARVLAAKSPELMRHGKAAFVAGIDQGYRQGVAGAVTVIGSVLATGDSREALAAFVEKRKAVWKGG
jgi:enoyl-CoA hydratase/carnithine racemase